MTSTENEKNFTNSKYLQSLMIHDLQKDHTELPPQTQDQQACTDAFSKKENKTLIADVESAVKGTLDTINCDQKKIRNEDEVIILENDKKQVKLNIDKIEHVQDSTESSDVMPSDVAENDLKISKNTNANETIIRTGNNLKRKRRNTM